MNWYKIALNYNEDDIYELYSQNTHPFSKWFYGHKEISIPFSPKHTFYNDIKTFLEKNNYEIVDYEKALCKKKNGNSPLKIGKVIKTIFNKKVQKDIINEEKEDPQLTKQRGRNYEEKRKNLKDDIYKKYKNKEDDYLKKIQNADYRKSLSVNANLYISITQDPREILDMSTNKKWWSCKADDGMYWQEQFDEIREGGFVAYLMPQETNDTNEALARVHIRRFDSASSGKAYAIPEKKVYGKNIQGFLEEIQKWIDSHQGELPTGIYFLRGGHYSDTFKTVLPHISSEENEESLLSILKNGKIYNLFMIEDKLYEEFLNETEGWESDTLYNVYDIDYSVVRNNTRIFSDYVEAEEYVKKKRAEDIKYGLEEREVMNDIMNKLNSYSDDNENKWLEAERYTFRKSKTALTSKDAITSVSKKIKESYDSFSDSFIIEFKNSLYDNNEYFRILDIMENYPHLINEQDVYFICRRFDMSSQDDKNKHPIIVDALKKYPHIRAFLWAEAIEKRPHLYLESNFPEDLRNNKEVMDAALKSFIRDISNDPKLYDNHLFPESFKQNKKILESRLYGWKKILVGYPLKYEQEDFPKDLKEEKYYEIFLPARIKGWAIALKDNNRHYLPYDILKAMREDEEYSDIIKKREEAWAQSLENNPQTILPVDILNTFNNKQEYSELMSGREGYYMQKIINEPFSYFEDDFPQDLKDALYPFLKLNLMKVYEASPQSYFRKNIPEDILRDPDIINAVKKGFILHFKYYPDHFNAYNLDTFFKEDRNFFKKIKESLIAGWIEAIRNDPIYYDSFEYEIPDFVKNDKIFITKILEILKNYYLNMTCRKMDHILAIGVPSALKGDKGFIINNIIPPLREYVTKRKSEGINILSSHAIEVFKNDPNFSDENYFNLSSENKQTQAPAIDKNKTELISKTEAKLLLKKIYKKAHK